jgi:FMN phosphatase YigB (HAD superfamily)
VRAADLDAVTVDAYGTLVTLEDPVPALVAVLAARGVEREPELVRAGFHAEVAYYAPRAGDGHDEESLTRLQRACAEVFLSTIGAELDAAEFAPAYVGALHFAVIPGAAASLRSFRALGLEVGVVANWDLSLGRVLRDVGLAADLGVVVHAAHKPEPDGFLRALHALGVDPARALHVGDDEADAAGAAAAGMHFAPAPITAALKGLR